MSRRKRNHKAVVAVVDEVTAAGPRARAKVGLLIR
jgi:hypothetical protein